LGGCPFLGSAFFGASFGLELLLADVFEGLIDVVYGWNGSDHFGGFFGFWMDGREGSNKGM